MSLQVRFELPENGWMVIEILHEEQKFSFAASYVHPESVAELVTALVLILSGNRETSMFWELEPNQMWFEFSTENDQTTFEIKLLIPKNVKSGASAETQLMVTMNKLELCIIFWRGLRYLQTNPDSFSVGWNNSFPDAAMNRFTEKLEAARRDIKS
jgi:hypothetical protein